ncbi:MAG: hypothetical protein JJ975_10545 [Bacteroidia bacterium]|nr:hypothetical protein [Bacteroidia bacterium]
MRNSFVLAIVAGFCLVLGCSSDSKFWALDHFDLNPSSLTHGDTVEVIYYDRGSANKSTEEGFYRHAIVVSGKTGDTVNVLTFLNPLMDDLTSSSPAVRYLSHSEPEEFLPGVDILTDDMRRMMEEANPSVKEWPKYSRVSRN